MFILTRLRFLDFFNKGITNANRVSILRGFAQEFSVKASVPDSFDGIPVLNNMAATFYYFIGDRQENDIGEFVASVCICVNMQIRTPIAVKRHL